MVWKLVGTIVFCCLFVYFNNFASARARKMAFRLGVFLLLCVWFPWYYNNVIVPRREEEFRQSVLNEMFRDAAFMTCGVRPEHPMDYEEYRRSGSTPARTHIAQLN